MYYIENLTHTGINTPSPLRTAYRPILALRTAYHQFLVSHTAYHFSTKTNNFGRFYLHKEDKMTVCRISGVSWHTPVCTCVRWTTKIRKLEKPKKLKKM